MDITATAAGLGLTACLPFDPALLEPEEHVRGYCRNNRCGSYGRNYMCPPYSGRLEKLRNKFRDYSGGWLLQYTVPLDVKNDGEGLTRSKLDFHRKVLEIERLFPPETRPWGLIGGSCGLCERCNVLTGKPCAHSRDARSSLESVGIDVSKLLGNLGLTLEFRDDRVTWTGCVLTRSSD
jgi:predicted metal-binding protein